MRSTAQRVQALETEADDLEREIAHLVTQAQPQLVQLPGVGRISAAQVLIGWSHPGRLRSEAAFATLAGAAPVPTLQVSPTATASTGAVIANSIGLSTPSC